MGVSGSYGLAKTSRNKIQPLEIIIYSIKLVRIYIPISIGIKVVL